MKHVWGSEKKFLANICKPLGWTICPNQNIISLHILREILKKSISKIKVSYRRWKNDENWPISNMHNDYNIWEKVLILFYSYRKWYRFSFYKVTFDFRITFGGEMPCWKYRCLTDKIIVSYGYWLLNFKTKFLV